MSKRRKPARRRDILADALRAERVRAAEAAEALINEAGVDRPRLLDLYSGAGGAAMGYHRAGFDVVGVDIEPQPHYPFEFHQANALAVLGARFIGWHSFRDFDAIHASPPCQAYSTATKHRDRHSDLYVATRILLEATGLPWVIENVPGAPYRSAVTLCGSSFDLKVRRHRIFEASFIIDPLACDHYSQGRPRGVYGHSGGKPGRDHNKASAAEAIEIMGMPWATTSEVVQAIPPAYTEHVGRCLMRAITPRTP